MLKRTSLTAHNSFTLPQHSEMQSPYKNLQESPSKKQPKHSLVIAQQLRSEMSHKKNLDQDFNKRLEEIKRKYTSPCKPSKTISTPMTPIDVGLSSKRLSITNENIFKTEESMTPTKITDKSSKDTPLPSSFHERQPLGTLNSTFSYPKQSFQAVHFGKRAIEGHRINSIDKINQKIKDILEGINFQNGKFIEKERFTSKEQQKIPIPALSARPEGLYQRQVFTNSSLQKREVRSYSINRSIYAESNAIKDIKYSTKDHESKMQQIQQRIKKSQQNRIKLMQNYKRNDLVSPPIISCEGGDKKAGIIESKTEIKTEIKNEISSRDRVSSGMYSHRYMDFGKNKSRNILQQLKSFSKNQVVEFDSSTSAPAINKVETRKLINSFVEQIKLDEQIRNGKIWLQSNQDSEKWTKLKEILSKKQGKSYTQDQIVEILGCSQDDHNPFYVNPTNQSFQNIVKKYVACQEHWRNKLYRRFDGVKLRQEGFKSQVLDLQMKGYLQIEDIVRYLNIETGKFYRNRDLALILKRMTKSSKINFQQLLSVIQF